MTKKVAFSFLILTHFLVQAQNEDALLWTSASIEGKINSDFNFELNTQFRFADNMSRLTSSFIQGTIDYEVGKLAKIALGYRLSNDLKTVNYAIDQRLFSDIKFKYELLSKLDIDMRMRFQHDFDRLSPLNDYILPQKRTLIRFRYGFDYSWKDCKPSISHELFYNVNDANLSRYRIIAGTSYKISKRHHLKFEYTLQKSLQGVPFQEHIYQIGYTYKLKGKFID
ncbi:MAG: DUF2490 domain-containing protein [Putridiphycobacter sp.]|nr:DUF2490 domain-containing protein [Putridiphycobacter sp.]